MPGRLIQDAASAADLFGPFGALPAAWKPRFNVAPGQKVVVVHQPAGARVAEVMLWGMVARGGRYGPQKFARSERLADMKSFEAHRCVVPMTGWYEWVESPDKSKRVYCIRPVDEKPLALAGIYSDEPEGPEFAVATCEPNADIKPLHHRMGVFLESSDVDTWLDSKAGNGDLKALLRQWPEGRFRHFEVSSFVSSPRNEGPKCVEPLASPSAGMFR